ncbi:hypothetical protein [Candidatus Methanoperedens nitratireducens]|uniref:Uncharacterized protein n=1 Tax=Candidatus Methanoperedens nitratireducens TaxID=1392998 RepID=A0A284VRQ5_9EURY|nr:hypothetical protein [Candidatus Methanoperedens nitroreducens]SNQ61889.1 hypothetical protein MNV_510005 [Candidatus Methanoperedens nitroreducens]
MIAKWNDDPEMGEVLSLRPGTAEEIEVLEKSETNLSLFSNGTMLQG